MMIVIGCKTVRVGNLLKQLRILNAKSIMMRKQERERERERDAVCCVSDHQAHVFKRGRGGARS
jgi:hypothetical protein